MTTITRRIVSILLLAALFCQPLLAWAEESDTSFAEDPAELADLADDPDALAAQADEEESAEEVEKYVAVATVALKVRRGPGEEYSSVDSIPADALVYILSLGEEWSKVRTRRYDGYVKSKYLKDIREYDPVSGVTGAETQVPEEVVDYTTGSTDDFKRGYKAYAVKTAVFYEEPDERSKFVTRAKTYQEVIVSHVEGDWCYAMYQNRTGWVRCDSLFKWDRIDPYAGDIPGCIVYPLMAFVNHSVEIRDYADPKKVLKTINPGSAICVEAADEVGRYKTPYWRKTGYVSKEDIAYFLPVVPYAEAQVGDLVSVMTTYYAVGVHTLNYQGRNWNIYLSTTMLSGTVLQPNEVLNVNKIIGPYRKSTGYKPAPIASPTALWGYGGGTCQVNTTLYNAIIRVPIYVNHRKVHANVGIKYMLKGFDAAVGGGDINMIFTNTLPYPIRINFFMSDGVLTCCIFRAG